MWEVSLRLAKSKTTWKDGLRVVHTMQGNGPHPQVED